MLMFPYTNTYTAYRFSFILPLLLSRIASLSKSLLWNFLIALFFYRVGV